MSFTWIFTTATRNNTEYDCMSRKKKIDLYVGGERDLERIMIPKDLSQFFNKERILLVFVVLVIMLLIAGAGL